MLDVAPGRLKAYMQPLERRRGHVTAYIEQSQGVAKAGLRRHPRMEVPLAGSSMLKPNAQTPNRPTRSRSLCKVSVTVDVLDVVVGTGCWYRLLVQVTYFFSILLRIT